MAVIVPGIEWYRGPEKVSVPRDLRAQPGAMISSSGVSQAWVRILAPGAITAGPCVTLGHCFLICTIGSARNGLSGLL